MGFSLPIASLVSVWKRVISLLNGRLHIPDALPGELRPRVIADDGNCCDLFHYINHLKIRENQPKRNPRKKPAP